MILMMMVMMRTMTVVGDKCSYDNKTVVMMVTTASMPGMHMAIMLMTKVRTRALGF